MFPPETITHTPNLLLRWRNNFDGNYTSATTPTPHLVKKDDIEKAEQWYYERNSPTTFTLPTCIHDIAGERVRLPPVFNNYTVQYWGVILEKKLSPTTPDDGDLNHIGGTLHVEQVRLPHLTPIAQRIYHPDPFSPHTGGGGSCGELFF